MDNTQDLKIKLEHTLSDVLILTDAIKYYYYQIYSNEPNIGNKNASAFIHIITQYASNLAEEIEKDIKSIVESY